MPSGQPDLLDTSYPSLDIARRWDKSESIPISGARLRRDIAQGDRPINLRPLSVCPTGSSANNQDSTLKVVRRYSAIHLDGSTSEPFLRDYIVPSRAHGADTPPVPAPARPAKSEYITKRYGMDFGPTKRVFEPPPRVHPTASDKYWEPIQQESAQPVQLSPYADSVFEDGASTVYDSFDFPQPPPFASPLIRRMQSNFWVQDENGYSQRLSQKQRAALGLEPTFVQNQTPRASRSTSTTATNEGDFWHQSRSSSSTISGHFSGDYLSRNPYSNATHERENLARIGDMLFGENAESWPDGIAASQSDDPRRPFASHTPSAFAQHRPPNITLSQSTPVIPSYATMNPATQHPADLQKQGRLPRIIRKVASMRSDTQKAEHAHEQPLSRIPAGQRAIPKARSFRSIFRSAEPDENQNKMPIFGNSSNRLSWLNAKDPRTSSSTHLAHYGEHAPGKEGRASFKHQGCYLPSEGDIQQLRDKRRSVNYAEPVVQHATQQSQWAQGSSRQWHPDTGSTSFIDLSPGNRDSRGEGKAGGKRERMKGFFSKTGSGLFGWGKSKNAGK